jgi:hypothetical protein
MNKGFIVFALCLAFTLTAFGQRGTTFTGTALIYGSGLNTRTVTRTFTLNITGKTSDADATRYLSILDRDGQDALLRAIDDNELGRFSLGGRVGLPLNAVFIDRDGDETRIRAILQRWIGFGELRSGARSTDYPFTYLEIRIDRRGKGDGTIIPAARVRFRGKDTLEVEDFGTFPGRLMGIQMRGSSLP